MMAAGEELHRPVLLDEVVRFFTEIEVRILLDATVGAGGHSAAFLESCGAEVRVLGIDRDREMVELARRELDRFGARVSLACQSFAELEAVLDEAGIGVVDGALFDLGASSVHFDRPERGMTFGAPAPLDMRFDRSKGETAADLVNRLDETRLTGILREFGGERHARAVARAIVAARPVVDTLRLADVVRSVVPRSGRIDPATRTFQALRIAVNDELDHVGRAIPAAVRRLRAGGRLVVISFHSGEDRLVKRLLLEEEREGRVRILTKKPLLPGQEEVRSNPRARSARLRACERKTGEGA